MREKVKEDDHAEKKEQEQTQENKSIQTVADEEDRTENHNTIKPMEQKNFFFKSQLKSGFHRTMPFPIF